MQARGYGDVTPPYCDDNECSMLYYECSMLYIEETRNTFLYINHPTGSINYTFYKMQDRGMVIKPHHIVMTLNVVSWIAIDYIYANIREAMAAICPI